MRRAAADYIAAGDAGLLPRERLGKLQDLFHGMLRLDLNAAIGHQLGHAAVEHVALAAALAEFFVQERKAGLHVADVAGQPRHQADIAGREILRQTGLFQAVAPGPPGGAEVLFGLGRAAGRGVRVLPGGGVPRIQRGQVFQRRQFPLGRGQAGGHRSAAAGKLVVQHGPLVLGLLDLHLQQPQLLLAFFKLLVVGSLHGELGQHGPNRDHQPHGRQGPEAGAGPRRENQQPQRENQDPDHEDHPQPDDRVDRRHLLLQQRLGLFLQFLLVAGHLLQPLVELHAAAKLVDEIAGLFGGRSEIGGLALVEGRRHLFVDAGGRLLGRLGLALKGLALLQAFPQTPARIAQPRQGLRRKMGQAVGLGPTRSTGCPAEAHLLVLGEHRGVQVVPLLLQFRNLAFQGAEPRLLLQRGRDAGPVPAQGLVDIQFFGLAAQGLPMPVETLHARLMLCRPLLDRLQAFDARRPERQSVGPTTPARRPTRDADASGRGPPRPGREGRVAAAVPPSLLPAAPVRARARRGRRPGGRRRGRATVAPRSAGGFAPAGS